MRDIDTHLLSEGDTLILLGEPSLMQMALKRVTGREVDINEIVSLA
jgi:hypothetical protein